MHPRFSNLVLATTALIALGAAPAAAGPNGPSVVGGAATVQGQGGPSVIVNQSTPNAIINWNTFNIGVNESVRFNQPSSSSVALNRVTGGLGPSEIMGTLTANGRVFIINRDGVLFGPGSVVNTAGFLATTSDIKNSDFMAGRYNFNIPGRPDASIVNQGRITATSGGFAALVAPGVRNSGTITATLGTVALASGNGFTLDLYGDKLITLAVNDQIASKVVDVATGQPLKSLVTNDGKIRANGGRVELTAAAARAVVDSIINTSGVIKANSIGRHNGMIVLSAATGASKQLKIVDVHRMVRGTNVPIAVIDSQIDVTHPDLEGAVAQRFDAAGAPEKPHPHGTGMAGAIAARQRLLGTAPAARLLAVHAFSASATTAESTTFNILKGINWSAQEGARIINMSFAGPSDPSLARALKAAYDKGIVLIAAAGNAGPKSPPLFPGADPYVIAVTATDVDDKLFTDANRGKYISVAAPGVDILVPAPEGEYQITTGTSVAAAEVSGIVALLLERNPKLTPADIRRILTASAKRLAPGERDDNFGSGLIDPLQALQLADPRIATTTPPRRR